MLGPKKLQEVSRKNHRRSEKRKLLHAVEQACDRLGRPVSSADLSVHFNLHPTERPCLTKRLGQQLISAAEPQRQIVPYLVQIGVFESKAYYATADTAEWRLRFNNFRVEELAQALKVCRIPQSCSILGGTIRNSVVDLAVAGWLAEVAKLTAEHSNPDQIRLIFGDEIDRMRARRVGDFIPRLPPLIGRKAAVVLVKREVARRLGSQSEISPHRHLARFRWPQNKLFPTMAIYKISLDQLDHFIRGKWPLEDEDPWIFQALAECGRYGRAT